MNNAKIPVRYARALYLLAAEHNVVEQIRADLDLVFNCIRHSAELQGALMSPVISNQTKSKIITLVFENQINTYLFSFLQLLVKNNRELYINDIHRDFTDIYRKELHIITASVTTASEINLAALENIKAIIKEAFKSEVELNREVKPSLIGGFVLRIGDQQIDNSIAGGLNRLRQTLHSTEYTVKQ